MLTEKTKQLAREITVIIPCYNSEKFMRATLESVAAQRLQPGAVVIADDGSTDGSVAIAEAFARSHVGCATNVLREPHRGPGPTRNAAVLAAQTPWVAFLDSDDLWDPDKVAQVVSAMEGNPQANIICHDQTIRFLDGTTRVTNLAAGYDRGRPLKPQMWRNNLFMTSAVVCRRDLILAVGGFDGSFRSAQDYELWLRMSPNLVPHFISLPLGSYIERRGNISTSRFWRQLRNLHWVRHRHREAVNSAVYYRVMVYATLFHLLAPIFGPLRRRFRHLSNPGLRNQASQV